MNIDISEITEELNAQGIINPQRIMRRSDKLLIILVRHRI